VPSILVVEDNPTTRKMLRLALVTEGYTDGRGGRTHEPPWPQAEATLPDLILQISFSRTWTGSNSFRRLRALPGATELPILALSVSSAVSKRHRRPRGVYGLTRKSHRPSRLIEAFRVYLPNPSALAPPIGNGRRLLVVDDDIPSSSN